MRPSKAARELNASLLKLRAALGTSHEAQALRDHQAVVARVGARS